MDNIITTPRGTVMIRQANEEDAASYRELRLEALRDNPRAFSSDYASQAARPQSWWAERLRSQSAESGLTLYFAVHEGQLVGMCGLAREGGPKTQHSATIVSMYVRPAWRGYHLAEGLVRTCMEGAQTAGVQIVKLAVVANNLSAIRCYARCGFQVYGVEPEALYYEGEFYDELMMAHKIGPV